MFLSDVIHMRFAKQNDGWSFFKRVSSNDIIRVSRKFFSISVFSPVYYDLVTHKILLQLIIIPYVCFTRV